MYVCNECVCNVSMHVCMYVCMHTEFLPPLRSEPAAGHYNCQQFASMLTVPKFAEFMKLILLKRV
jgi:hypothetical protein